MGCCFTRNKYNNEIPRIIINMEYKHGQPYIEIIKDAGVELHYIVNRINNKFVKCEINNTIHNLIINVDDAYNGIMPIGPPFMDNANTNKYNYIDDGYTIDVVTQECNSNSKNKKCTNLIHRSPRIVPYDNPNTIIDMLQYLNNRINNDNQ